jgi:hypothetical protein
MADADAVEDRWAGAGSTPPHDAFHVETIVDPFTLADVVGMVRHPGCPYVIQGVDSRLTLEEQCQRMGLSYLNALQRAAALPAEQWIHPRVLEALALLREPEQRRFGWLPITWPDVRGDPAGRRQPLGSFWADRSDADVTTARPRLLVLLAGAVDTENQLQFGSDMGLRIVLHVHADEVRIHGVTLAGLTNTRALDAVPDKPAADRDIFDLVGRVRSVVGDALNCGGQVWINNLENVCRPDAPSNHVIAVGYALRWPKPGEVAEESVTARARTYDFRVELAVDPAGRVQLVRVHRDLHIGAGAAATLSCFVQDAASNYRADLRPSGTTADSLARRRATLSDDALDKFRDKVSAELAGGRALKFSDAGVDFFETRAASVRSRRRLGGATVASDGRLVTAARKAPPVRSDEQAAVDAHVRAAEFFGRMLAYGLDPGAYFRFARLPLVQRARPAMRWAPDGELPSAEVRPFLDAAADGQPPQKPSDPLQLLVNYGSADPVHRHKLPLAGGARPVAGRLKAQYLSVASDPRWAWHEFGHVLNFASTGELEFPFAHSAGDALAAIATDPISRLAGANDPDDELRHATYPWIEVPGRSHGRSPMRGYGWCGCRNLSRLNFTASLERYHHTYFGEQIMSSSLFRLYRSLGGDTRGPGGMPEDDEKVRLSASDYCIYLIMRGISLLGPDTLAPARTPDQFVSALIDADLGTGAWDVDATWPFNREARQVSRQGGRVHKVIRWAFEQQGLFATRNPRETVEGPGLPPLVDVYIADRRRDDGDAGDGGYAPVPLRHGDVEAWHAHAGWLRRANGQLTVRVANRGSAQATGTGLRIWWMTPAAAAAVLTWVAVPAQVVLQDISGAGRIEFQCALPAEADTHAELWILVSADVSTDPSNLAIDALPPESWPELLALVAHDNNLALARI